ncbi:hypothetical protein EYZ11_009244 [Aspergillus tanneri]|uniref:Uncharacterized protein n=1 Tax=Aspergillus tanneri TaxID=1220188 RepID=A0A4V3UNH8_9EURO|nr:hypothetical protein EYZ11_009244 [Aspergillus tanneri]
MVIDHLSAVATETAPDSKGQAHQPVWDAIDQQLSSLCTEAGNEKPIFGGKLESISIRLPRITLVRMVELQFFQRWQRIGQFSQLHTPNILTLHVALASFRILMVPKLINLQTLTLLESTL